MNIKFVNIIKKFISVSLAIVFILNTTCDIYAKDARSDVQKEISTLKVSLEKILEEKQDVIIDSIKESIVENEWDYGLTIDNISKINDYKNNYLDIIATYISCKQYYIENGKNFEYIESLPLVNYTFTEEKFEESIPYKDYTYIEYEEGKFLRDKEHYIYKNETIDNYVKGEDEYYYKDGTKEIEIETQEVRYGKYEIHIMTADEMMDYYEIPTEYRNIYKEKLAKLEEYTSNEEFTQTLFISLPQMLQELDREIPLSDDISREKKYLLEIATSLIGQVPYEYGGKPSKKGYDNTWWTYTEDGKQKGLDCTGFLQWVYMTAGYSEDTYKYITSSTDIKNNYLQIDKGDLQIGDIGILYESAPVGLNHVGIYVGGDKWIHCSSTYNTVAISDLDMKLFYRVINKNNKQISAKDIDNVYQIVYSTNSETNLYTNDEVYELAQLVTHEAESEGLNGWIAVAEVVRNRIESELYPNTVHEVVFQSGQFANASQIKQITPSEEIIETTKNVLCGKMGILNNKEVLYFRNPTITDGIKATEEVNWGDYPYYTHIGHHAFYTQS